MKELRVYSAEHSSASIDSAKILRKVIACDAL